ncbi:P-loop NTPase [Streptosporangium sandarakinum]|uniref:P-loop NTPase n=1 Tax=Streptosporangium sandarakinum TaxID=1260955 RepID=UPI0036C70B94
MIAPRLVLTSAHVTGPAGAAVRVFHPGRAGMFGGAVVWAGTPGGRDDAALVAVDDPAWEPPQGGAVRWGRTVTYRPGIRCESWGLPSFAQREDRPAELWQPAGTLNPGDRYVGDRYVMTLDGHPPQAAGAGGSPWEGMSGAALVCGDLLAGVIAADPAHLAHARLEVVPAYVLFADPGFRRVLAEHTGRADQMLEPIEYQHLAEPAEPAGVQAASPAALLQPHRQVVPFRGREEILTRLHAWAQRPGFGACLVHAAGGQGKTRLARHLTGRLAASGWAVVWLDTRAAAADLAAVKDAAAPLLIVIDGAETRTGQMTALLQATARHDGTSPIKVLLLARTAGFRWQTLPETSQETEQLLDGAAVLPLPVLEPDADSQIGAYRQAAAAFAAALAALPAWQDHPWARLAADLPDPPRREELGNALTLHMTALADLLDRAAPAPDTPDMPSSDGGNGAKGVEERLQVHERRYWRTAAGRGLHPAVSMQTLTDALTATPAPGRPIGHVRPMDLEIHPAIRVGTSGRGLEELPAYIPRAHDETLAEVVREVRAGASRLVVLVGGSSTGKTRALWEAVKSLPEPWRLWHPIDPGRPAAVLAELPQVGPHTVVWLNETQHYLLTADAAVGEQVAGGLREVLRTRERGPVLVLGTLWPDYWTTLTAVPDADRPDPYAQARELIKNASIRLPESFTGTDLDAARLRVEQEGDPRLAEAVRQASAGRLTQYLAGGPALLERYDNAEPAARAVLDAAIDARRLGHGLALPRLLLEQAAPGYLSEEEWDLLGEDWLERAFAYLTDHRPCRGARPPLSRIRPRPAPGAARTEQSGEPFYRLADYLEQHGTHTRRLLCPPATFWDAAICYAATMSDHQALAWAARDRGRYRYAFALYQAAADAGDLYVLGDLAEMREQAGDHAGAERLARAAADAGDPSALWKLAWMREQAGDHAGAERLYQAAADAGDTSALRDLARMREQAGDHAEVERLARAIADAGDTSMLRDLAMRWEQAGDHAGAERLARAIADTGDPSALRDLAWMREQAGDHAGAERLYQAVADVGDTSVLRKLTEMREDAGDHAGAERLARAAADVGDTSALRHLAKRRAQESGGRWAKLLRYGLEADGSIAAPW